MNFCSSCGNPIKPGDRFCNTCGAPVQQPAQPQTTQPVQSPYQQPVQTPYQQPVQPQYQPPVQPQYQQPIQQQPVQQWTPPTYPEGTPVLTIVYPGVDSNFMDTDKRLNYINIQVNGVDIVPPNTIKKGEKFSIDVPITSPNIRIEIWITGKLGKKSKPQSPNFFNSLNVFDITVNPSESYIFEILDPSALVGNSKYGYLLGDKNGNFIEGQGQYTSWWKQIVALLLPPVGIFFLFSPEAKEDKVTRDSYILPIVTGIILWIITIIEILTD